MFWFAVKLLWKIAFCLLLLVGSVNADDSTEWVKQLPQDQGKWSLTVFGAKADPNYQRLESWFQGDERLSAVKDQTHFQMIEANSVMNSDRYGVKKLPCVRLQGGEFTAEIAGKELVELKSPAELYSHFSNCILKRCTPKTEPVEEPVKEEPSVVEAPPFEPVEEPQSETPAWIWVLLATIGAGIGFHSGWQDTYYR